MRRQRTLGQRVLRSAGYPLAGGLGCTAFIAWSQAHWWVGPLVVVVTVLSLAVLWRW